MNMKKLILLFAVLFAMGCEKEEEPYYTKEQLELLQILCKKSWVAELNHSYEIPHAYTFYTLDGFAPFMVEYVHNGCEWENQEYFAMVDGVVRWRDLSHKIEDFYLYFKINDNNTLLLFNVILPSEIVPTTGKYPIQIFDTRPPFSPANGIEYEYELKVTEWYNSLTIGEREYRQWLYN